MEMKRLQLGQMFNIFGIHLLPNPEAFQCPLCAGDIAKGSFLSHIIKGKSTPNVWFLIYVLQVF